MQRQIWRILLAGAAMSQLAACNTESTAFVVQCWKGNDDTEAAEEPGSDNDSGGTNVETDSGGAGTGGDSSGDTEVPFTLTSTAFSEGEVIPTVHECGGEWGSGEDSSPPLSWAPGPEKTGSYAVVMRDLDMNDLVHWVIYDIPGSVHSLSEGIPFGYEVADPAGARQAKLHNLYFGYFGPCSKSGIKTYRWTVHAMEGERLPGVEKKTTENEIAAAIEGSSQAQASLSGLSGES